MLSFNVIYITCVVIIFSLQYNNKDNLHNKVHNIHKTRYSLIIYFKRLLIEYNETVQLEKNPDENSSTELDDNERTRRNKKGGSKTNLLLEEYGDPVVYDKEEMKLISELLNSYLEDERHLCMIKRILDYTKIYRNPLLLARYRIKKFLKRCCKKIK
ncbi:hypothetical protein PFMG_03979 [Plasmodium falciparum IGH-CR14]|uniref:Uncharacterized protein n=1 Tax=Plasmodium falciparum IGH-CR14 TaxID=580059 RepID=A0A0L1IEM6_PLAFA|nr:hypothetical protein PFMG_03979 [Plasmodium falciparum IGH-CR14]